MKHFVSVIFRNQLNESKRDIVLDTVTNTAKIGLIKSNTNYVIFESENNSQVLRLPLKTSIPTNLQKRFVEALANRLFDKGHNNFEIELSIINEATLRRGSRGPEVQALQQQLGIPADGIFGPQTEQAVRAFQQRAGIQVDGIVGGQTQSALAAGGAARNAGVPRPATPTAPTEPSMNLATSTPATGGGRGDGNAEVARRRADAQNAASDRQLIARAQGAAPATGGGRGDGNAEVARRRADAQNAASDRQLIARAQGAAPAASTAPRGAAAAGTTQPARPITPTPRPSGATQAAVASQDAGTLDPEQNVFLAPELQQPARTPTTRTAPSVTRTPAAPAASVAAQASADAGTLDPEQAVFLSPEVTGQTSSNVTPRPTGSGRNVRGSQQSWDRRYGATHNPDGTPKNESVMPRPKGAFLFRERAEWDKQYGSTHNTDGTKKSRRAFFESRNIQEETYDGDDFFEAYGVMWYNEDEELDEAEYQGRSVKLGKPMRGDVKKFKVYVRNPKGNIVKVNFGDPDMKIKKSNPERRRSFRARHNCDNPGPRHKARYWSCRKW